ncbi:hypothetical protein G7Y79_00067g095590 [Physcia stellaris]|nr:hypothetical protein G7Y79_00067g095590 [Physcia stellaris]
MGDMSEKTQHDGLEASPKTEEYFLSQNPDEVERLRLQHEVIKDHFGGSLIAAPIDLSRKGLSILDSATADGHFLRSLSLANPHSTGSTYTGTDITASYFPPETPPDTTYVVHDITQPYPAAFPNRPFDLIHQRLALPGCGPASMKTAVERLVAMLKPGGWIQLIEADPESDPSAGLTLHTAATGAQDQVRGVTTNGAATRDVGDKKDKAEIASGAMRELYAVLREMFAQAGIQTGYAKSMAGWLKDFGLEEVRERVCDLRLGAQNPKEDIGGMGARSYGLAAKGIVAVASSKHTPSNIFTFPTILHLHLTFRAPVACSLCTSLKVFSRGPVFGPSMSEIPII